MNFLWLVVCSALLVLGTENSFGDYEAAKPADSFIDSIGVVTHQAKNDAYGNFPGIIQPELIKLGVRHIRAGFEAGADPIRTTNYNNLAAVGIRYSLLMRLYKPEQAVPLCLGVLKGAEMIEGPNEPDLEGFNYKGKGFPQSTFTYQNELYQAMKSNPATASLPVLCPSMGFHDHCASQGVVNCDAGNAHAYSNSSTYLPDATIDNWICNLPLIDGSPAKPIYVTETGYSTCLDHGHGVSEIAQAKYTTRTYLDFFKRDIVRTYIYEFMDQWALGKPTNKNHEGQYGMIAVDSAGPNPAIREKPSFTWLMNMIVLLRDPGSPFVPTGLDYSFNIPGVEHILLQKRDGSYWLVVWQNVRVYDEKNETDLVTPPKPVLVTFNQSIGNITIYKPSASQDPINSYANVSSLNLDVLDEPLLVKIAQVGPLNATSLSASISGYGTGEGTMSSKDTSINYTFKTCTIGTDRNGQSQRAEIKFDLPPLPNGKAITSATFSFSLDRAAPSGTPANVDLVAYQPGIAPLRPNDWNDNTNSITIATSILTPSTPKGAITLTTDQYPALLQAIQNAYKSGKAFLALRFQLSDNNAIPISYIILNSNTASHGPKLVLNF